MGAIQLFRCCLRVCVKQLLQLLVYAISRVLSQEHPS